MDIIVTSRFRGLNRQDAIRLAKAGKAVAARAGALSFTAMVSVSGTGVGDVIAIWRYRDWAHYGEVQAVLSKDTGFHSVIAELRSLSQLVDRELATELDLS